MSLVILHALVKSNHTSTHIHEHMGLKLLQASFWCFFPWQAEHTTGMSKKGKTPWISYNEEQVADSELCIKYLSKTFSKCVCFCMCLVHRARQTEMDREIKDERKSETSTQTIRQVHRWNSCNSLFPSSNGHFCSGLHVGEVFVTVQHMVLLDLGWARDISFVRATEPSAPSCLLRFLDVLLFSALQMSICRAIWAQKSERTSSHTEFWLMSSYTGQYIEEPLSHNQPCWLVDETSNCLLDRFCNEPKNCRKQAW